MRHGLCAKTTWIGTCWPTVQPGGHKHPIRISCPFQFNNIWRYAVTSQKPWAGAWHWVGFGATHSPAEYPSEVPVERIDPDGLDRQQGLVVNIELAAAGGLSEAEPVGGLVSSAAKA